MKVDKRTFDQVLGYRSQLVDARFTLHVLQELLHSNAKQRREQEHKEHLIRQALDERSKRQQLQLSWASLEQTMQVCAACACVSW